MEKISDIGIIDIDDCGYINRWFPLDRNKHLSNFLPLGPGWVPEHYLSFIINFQDGGFLPPNYFIHMDNNKGNNQPENVDVVKCIKDKYQLYLPNDELDIYHKQKRISPNKSQYVYGGFYQDKIIKVPNITRCSICGMPTFGEPYHSQYIDDVDLCPDCYRDFYIDEDDFCKICLLTDKDNDPINNIYIDFNRGLSIPQIRNKYKNTKDLEKMISLIESGKYHQNY